MVRLVTSVTDFVNVGDGRRVISLNVRSCRLEKFMRFAPSVGGPSFREKIFGWWPGSANFDALRSPRNRWEIGDNLGRGFQDVFFDLHAWIVAQDYRKSNVRSIAFIFISRAFE